mgnify:CR=1 FL=1
MKQDYFTRDKGKLITHKNVGSEVRLSPAGMFKKALAKAKGEKELKIKHK